jgi:cell fate regulator YaaT (PSP1 superfamily)
MDENKDNGPACASAGTLAPEIPGLQDLYPGSCVRCKQLDLSHPYVIVRILHTSETELCRKPEGREISVHTPVIIPTKYGCDLGVVTGSVSQENASFWKDVRSIKRTAGPEDLDKYRENISLEAEAFGICEERIRNHKLEMKLVSVHYLFDEPKIVFFFTADGRVDFRELVKDLVAEFRVRIELRQIGVRDESRVLGGRGVCGRSYCCHGVTDKLRPVSIKMAKVQNLSLNSMKISGPCGRLLCCLAYEYDFYQEERKKMPEEGIRIRFEDITFRIIDVNVLTREVKLYGEDGRYMVLPVSRLYREDGSGKWNITPEENED